VPTTERIAPKQRLRREDWESAALDAIAAGGFAAVAVEPLARRLGVTKGSFYAHFSTREQLIEAALARWEKSHGVEGLIRFAEIADPVKRLSAMLQSATEFSQSGAPSVHMSLLAELDDPRVRKAIGSATRSRLELLTKSYRQLGLPPQRAAHRARVAYATYLGLMQMAREEPRGRLSKSEIGRFMRELQSALLPGAIPG
jgi:AcrR family transcriptional regulator